MRAGEKWSRCALRRYCGHKPRFEISCCRGFSGGPGGATQPIRFPLLHGVRHDVCFPSCFRDGRCRLSCKPFRRDVTSQPRQPRTGIKALRDVLTTHSVTNATPSPTSVCCRWNNEGILQWTPRPIAFALTSVMWKLSVWVVHKQKTTSCITMNVHVLTSVSVKVGVERTWLCARSIIFAGFMSEVPKH